MSDWKEKLHLLSLSVNEEQNDKKETTTFQFIRKTRVNEHKSDENRPIEQNQTNKKIHNFY